MTASSARNWRASSVLWVLFASAHCFSILITSASIAFGSNVSFAGLAAASAAFRLVSRAGWHPAKTRTTNVTHKARELLFIAAKLLFTMGQGFQKKHFASTLNSRISQLFGVALQILTSHFLRIIVRHISKPEQPEPNSRRLPAVSFPTCLVV